jgi:hypothetical protein
MQRYNFDASKQTGDFLDQDVKTIISRLDANDVLYTDFGDFFKSTEPK